MYVLKIKYNYDMTEANQRFERNEIEFLLAKSEYEWKINKINNKFKNYKKKETKIEEELKITTWRSSQKLKIVYLVS